MPFPDLITTGFTALEDSKNFSMSPLDGAIKFDTDGGLSLSRKRFTRSAGYAITTGYTEISDSDKLLFDNYFIAQGGCANILGYVHPISGALLYVRFTDVYKAAYVGVAGTRMWTLTDIKLRTA